MKACPEQTNNFNYFNYTTRSPMVGSSKRARRRQKAHESLEREASHSNPAKRPKSESDPEEEEEADEILFPSRNRENYSHAIVAGESSGSSRL